MLLSMDEYEDLVDARGHEAAMRAVASGAMETLSEDPLPLTWQRRRPWRSGAVIAT